MNLQITMTQTKQKKTKKKTTTKKIVVERWLVDSKEQQGHS
jgi:hypothetical protein